MNKTHEHCESCRYWEKIGDSSLKFSINIGHCTRYPPTVICRVSSDYDSDYDQMVTSSCQITTFPETTRLEKCGEYKHE